MSFERRVHLKTTMQKHCDNAVALLQNTSISSRKARQNTKKRKKGKENHINMDLNLNSLHSACTAGNCGSDEVCHLLAIWEHYKLPSSEEKNLSW